MKYTTNELQNKKTYIQYDENRDLMAIYHFDSSVLNKITIINMPEYLLLPRIGIGRKREFGVDYTVDCACFKDLDNPIIVSSGSEVRFVNNNHTNLNIVLATDQGLYGVRNEQAGGAVPYGDPSGCLVIKHNSFQSEKHKKYSFEGFPAEMETTVDKITTGFETAPKYDFGKGVLVCDTQVYNQYFNRFEDVQQSNEQQNEKM